jgi:alditol oxidase
MRPAASSGRLRTMTEALTTEHNWAGNHVYRARALHRPRTLEELQEIVSRASGVHVLGSRHSFNDIADADELISFEALRSTGSLPDAVEIDRAAGTVSFGAGTKYGELVQTLDDEGLALHNLASLPHISVAGAVATATHGSGVRHGNLATAVAALELVTSTGEVVRAARGERDFDGMVVGLGALGAVTRVTLDVVPAFEVAQHAYEGLSWDALDEHFDELAAAAYSVSFFTGWHHGVDHVVLKRRTDEAGSPPDDLHGAVPATADLHPIRGLDATPCTPQLGRPGPWWDRLPHFRMGFTPSAGEEIQSEVLLPREHSVAAFDALRRISDRFRPLLQIAEIRTVAADGLWMSMNHETDSTAIHFTWRREQEAVERVVAEIEEALAPFRARPHWGKVFHADAATIAGLYPRHRDFVALQERLDPRGAFRNPWLRSKVLGDA